VSLIASLLLSARLQRRISDPILELVQTARTVSDQKNYAVRASATAGTGEVGLLANTLNEMLNQIERQDAELRRAVAARDEFLSIASHELKTPLTPLQLQVQSLQRLTQRNAPTPIHGKLTTGLEVMDKQVVRLTTLVNNLLDISRITSQRLLLNLEEVDLRQLVQEVVVRFRQELLQAGCTLTVHAPDPVVGLWDRSRLDQVATNLLSNAMKYGAGKPIEISVEGTTDHGRLRVRDNGIGVAPEDQARIFDRFERAVSEHNYGGFGLGLWITRQIVECSGGTILVHSQPGAGATFVVELPLKAPQATEGPAEEKAEATS
jgi:signal transduction histidine kinase